MPFLVSLNWSGNTGNVESENGRSGTADDSLVYSVFATTPLSANAHLAKYANGVPVIGQAHPYDQYMRCTRKSVNTLGPMQFEVTCYFQKSTTGENDNPLDDPPKVEIFTVTTEEETDEDINGNPIVTVNGEPIRGVTRPITDLGFRIQKNVPIYQAPFIQDFFDSTNSQPFFGFPKGTVKVKDLQMRNEEFDGAFQYAVINSQFQVRKQYRESSQDRVWWKRTRHQGFYVKFGELLGAPLIAPALDANGEPVTQPVPLKADGTRETDPSKGHWLEWPVLGEADYNNLGLGV